MEQNDPNRAINQTSQRSIRQEMSKKRNNFNVNLQQSIIFKMSNEEKLANALAQMKGSSSWLTALPLQQENYVLNKREFYDSIAIRYRWHLKTLPSNCTCGKPFSLDHAVSCIKGDFVHRRHNEIHDIFAKLLEEVSNEYRKKVDLT